MKKVLGILSILIVLLSGTTIRYSAHYCQGVFIASRLSLTGANATCGMNQDKTESKGNLFSNLMCVNEIASYTFNDNYVYSPKIHEITRHIQDIEMPTVIIPIINSLPAPEFRLLSDGSPGPPKAETEILCVFRI